jgi:hypothetical protein
MKTFFQASWVNRNGATVYSDIDTRWDRVHMQLPLYVVSNYTKHETHGDSARQLIRDRIMHEPTPRAERETAK